MNSDQLKRYERHIMLEDVGAEGQEKILKSKVLIIGVGGLGSPVSLYLAAAGVGTIGIADGDIVQSSNLQRQVIHFTDDLQREKVKSAYEKITKLNPDIKVNTYNFFLDESKLVDIIKDYDIVIDATDNFDSKFMINDVCIKEEKILSHGGVLKYSGQAMTIIPNRSACYRCVFGDVPNNPDKYSKAGIFGSVAGILGSIQATEVLKVITEVGDILEDRLLTFDAKSMSFRTVNIKRDSHCHSCGN